jgi:tight adherence protein C
LTHQADRTKQVIIDKLCGFAIVAVGCLVGVFMRNPIVMVVGLVIAFPFIALPIHFVESAAEKRRFVVADELPRFLDMLHTALIMGFPVDQAIEITAQNLRGTILAEELLKTLAETKVGAYSWQEALERLASMYGVDTLSDFVLDITNAYKLGSSITESVARKSKDIKQSNLVAMKERASKLTNTILFPILFFKIVPIIALMGVPIVVQLQATGF